MKKQRPKKPAPEKEIEKLSSVTIKTDYSMEEIQKMLQDIDTTVSAYKAEQLGFDPDNMIKTIRGGRVIWITVDEMNAILSKQRKVLQKKYKERSIRAENNLSSEINRRVEACRSLIHAIRKVSPDNSPEFTRLLRNLESLQNLSVHHAHEVRMIEMAIQRKKQEDPILQEMDNATSNMLNALNREEIGDVEICQSFCNRHMDEYLARQKRIEPYLKKAKEYRQSFLLSKQQLFQFQFNIIEKGEEILSHYIEEIIYWDKEGSVSQSIVQLSSEIREIIRSGRPAMYDISACSLAELEEKRELFSEADKNVLTPLFNKMTDFINLFKTGWSEFVEKKSGASTILDESPQEETETKRMAYQEKQEKKG